MEKKELTFKLIELREVTNNDGQKRIMVKWYCEFIKSVTSIGDFEEENPGKLTYYMYIEPKNLPEGYELGVQTNPREQVIEHYYEGAGVWKPTKFSVIERDVMIKIKNVLTKVRIKAIKPL